MQYSSDEESSPVPAVSAPVAVVSKSSGKASSLALPAIAAVSVAAVVGIGARWILGRRGGKRGGDDGGRGKRGGGRVVPSARRIPPRRPRSVASSVDGGAAVRRYV